MLLRESDEIRADQFHRIGELIFKKVSDASRQWQLRTTILTRDAEQC